jgi:hypothetical protein
MESRSYVEGLAVSTLPLILNGMILRVLLSAVAMSATFAGGA